MGSRNVGMLLFYFKKVLTISWTYVLASCSGSSFCSGLLLTCRTALFAIRLSTLFWWVSTRAGWRLLSGFWGAAVEEELVLSLPLRSVNLLPSSWTLIWVTPKNDPEVRRSRILKMSSDKVPLFSSPLSWMRLHLLRASALAAIPVRGQLKVGRVWVRLRGLPDQSSVPGDVGSWRTGLWRKSLLSGPGLSVSSSSSGDSDKDASPSWAKQIRLAWTTYGE